MSLGIKKIRKTLRKLLNLIESHLGLIVWLIFIIIILYAGWLFYNFCHKTISTTPEVSFEKIEIKKALFDRVTEQLELKENNILESIGKEYLDVFR